MSARNFGGPISLNRNEIQLAVMHALGSAPSSPVEGLYYWNSSTKRMYVYDATAPAWQMVPSTFADLVAKPTTLSGYGITDALSNSASSVQDIYGGDLFLRDDTTPSHYLQITAAENLSANRSLGIITGDAARTLTFTANASIGGTSSGTNTGDQTITLTGDVTGSGTGSFAATLATVNGSPQTDQFRKITVNGKGLVTASTAVVAADIPTLTSAKISDFDTQVRTSRLDQMAAPTASVSLNTQKITNLLAGTAASDAVNLQQLQDQVMSTSWKEEVRAATTAAVTLATGLENGDVIDGVTLATNDRILVKDQAAGAENGIYTVNVSGAPTRATDADSETDIRGSAVFVANGTTLGGTRWVLNNTGAITLGTTALTFAQFGGGNTYTAGNGLALSGNDFNVGAGTGITVDATNVNIDTAVVARKATALIGNNSATSIAVTHSLGNQWVTAQVIKVSTLKQWDVDVELTDANTTTFIFAVAPTTNEFRAIITG